MQKIIREVNTPEANILFHVKHVGENLTTIVAGGRAPNAKWLQKVSQDTEVYCADKGVEYCLKAGLEPVYVCGDCDSAKPQSFEKAHELGAEIERYPRDKDRTDLQLLLQHIKETDLIASGVWGGRFDHLYSNIFSILNWKRENKASVLLADEKEQMIILEAKEDVRIIFQKKPKAVSILPLTIKAMVDLIGTKWPLHKEDLSLLNPYAISNELIQKELICCCVKGCIGLYVNYGDIRESKKTETAVKSLPLTSEEED